MCDSLYFCTAVNTYIKDMTLVIELSNLSLIAQSLKNITLVPLNLTPGMFMKSSRRAFLKSLATMGGQLLL